MDSANASDQRIAFSLAKRWSSRRSSSLALTVSSGRGFPKYRQCAGARRVCVTTPKGNVQPAAISFCEAGARAAERSSAQIVRLPGSRSPVLLSIIRRFDPMAQPSGRLSHTEGCHGPHRRKSQLNHVVQTCAGNSWEEGLAAVLRRQTIGPPLREERNAGLHDSVRHQGRSQDTSRTLGQIKTALGMSTEKLIMRCSGRGQKSPGPTAEKADDTHATSGAADVNHWGSSRRWSYLEVGNQRFGLRGDRQRDQATSSQKTRDLLERNLIHHATQSRRKPRYVEAITHENKRANLPMRTHTTSLFRARQAILSATRATELDPQRLERQDCATTSRTRGRPHRRSTQGEDRSAHVLLRTSATLRRAEDEPS